VNNTNSATSTKDNSEIKNQKLRNRTAVKEAMNEHSVSSSCQDFMEAKNPLLHYQPVEVSEQKHIETTCISEWIIPQTYIDSVTPLVRIKKSLPKLFTTREKILKLDMNVAIIPGDEKTYSIFKIKMMTKDKIIVQRYDKQFGKYLLDDPEPESFNFDSVTIIHWGIVFNKNKTLPARDQKVIKMCPSLLQSFVRDHGRGKRITLVMIF